jgi:diadenosine tetraphosphate (Ap4A) HIT family hydrolase
MSCDICHVVENGQPGHIIRLAYWDVNVSHDQGYLGRGFIALRRHAASLSELTIEEWLELKEVMVRYESGVKSAFGAEMFNWVCLMNDAYKEDPAKPHVHWHVRPRYLHPVIVDGREYQDPNFAHHYDRAHRFMPDDTTRDIIADQIKKYF